MGDRWIPVAAGMILAGMHTGIAGEAEPGESVPKGADKVRTKEGEKRMRWKFGGKGDEEHRTEMIRRIDEWWKAFERDRAKIVATFKNRNDLDLPGWMAEHLQAIDKRLMWEYGPGLKGGHRLVITPESDRFPLPLVATILERAPRIDGWEFYPYRLSESVDDAKAMLKARRLASIAATRVRVTRGEYHLIDLEYLAPEYAGPEDRKAHHSVFVATEVILGEEMLDTWVGAIEVERGERATEDVVELEHMKEAVEAEIAAIRKSLPNKPAGKLRDDTAWTLWDLKPKEASDYPEQRDLFVGKSMFGDMWTAAHSGALFSSQRFSRFGELFCYVKTDGSVDLSDEKFADKAAIEDALDAALKASGTGAVVGGGTGLRYSYVDLALTDPDKGIHEAVDVLRKGNMVKRTWILFFDDIYRSEWVGVWDDSPAPPGME